MACVPGPLSVHVYGTGSFSRSVVKTLYQSRRIVAKSEQRKKKKEESSSSNFAALISCLRFSVAPATFDAITTLTAALRPNAETNILPLPRAKWSTPRMAGSSGCNKCMSRGKMRDLCSTQKNSGSSQSC